MMSEMMTLLAVLGIMLLWAFILWFVCTGGDVSK